MATCCIGRRSTTITSHLYPSLKTLCSSHLQQSPRFLRTSITNDPPRLPSFAFAFDIDGVLLRSSEPLPRAHRTLSYLQTHSIPFVLLTNGGGKSESERVQQLSELLEVPLDTSMFVQSHTPFAELANGHGQDNLKNKCILVVGGEGDKCRKVAEGYGFSTVVTPSDIISAHPTLWPFVSLSHHKPFAKPLPPFPPSTQHPPTHPAPKIDAILVFNDPRDWALDTQLILDLLLSKAGHLGTLSPKNNNPHLPNRGYQQDAQPPLYYSNPDLFWASSYPLPRLGQGAFQAALEGVFNAVTGGPANGVRLQKHLFGKPTQGTFAFAENRLRKHRASQGGILPTPRLTNVYMVGDNPESDIRGANEYRSAEGTRWHSVLVRSGVYSGGTPAYEPRVVVEDVWDAVRYGLRKEGVGVDGDEGG
ncbi:putative HAD superfamily hydrolase [Usnea florida]